MEENKMSCDSQEELQLSKKHEDILGRRAVLLQQMEICYEQQKAKKKHQAAMSRAAQERNAEILEDFHKLEESLQTRPFLHPDVLNLQTHYWASVEQKLPEWESYLLGKCQAPPSAANVSQGIKDNENNSSPARSNGRPPRPKPKSDVN